MTRRAPRSPDGVDELLELKSKSTSLPHCLQIFSRPPPGFSSSFDFCHINRAFADAVPSCPLRRLGWQISSGKSVIFPFMLSIMTTLQRM
jgi:hypothetical protein